MEGEEEERGGKGEPEGRRRMGRKAKRAMVHEKRSMIMLHKAFVAGRMCLSNYPSSSLLFTC